MSVIGRYFLLMVATGIFLLVAGTGTVYAQCVHESYVMTFPKMLDESKLADGEHLLAALLTPRGLLEARAQAKGASWEKWTST